MFSQPNKLLIIFQMGATSGKHRKLNERQKNKVLSFAPLLCDCAPITANAHAKKFNGPETKGGCLY